MNVAVVQSRKSIQQDLRYYLPRWMVVFLAITLIQELAMSSPKPQGLWTIPSLILIGLIEGAVGGLVFVGLQRLNPKDSRPRRIRNCLIAGIIVGVGSLWAMTAIFS